MNTRVIAAVMLVASTARADYIERFIGWSKDGSFYAMAAAGTDETPWPRLCLSKRDRPSPTWPKDVPAPDADDEDGCSGRWGIDIFTDGTDVGKLGARATALVEKPRSKPANGETVDVHKVADGTFAEVTVTRGKKVIARGFITLRRAGMVPGMIGTSWRADGLAVAVEAGFEPPTDPGPGFGPPAYLVVLPLDGSAANAARPKSPRELARALNVEGMQLLGKHQLDAAQAKFVEATKTDDTFALAYYNLASVASLRHDASIAVPAIEHVTLLARQDGDAKRALAKAKTDTDLDFIAGESPYVKQLLGRTVTKDEQWCVAVEKRARDINLVNYSGVANEIALSLDAAASDNKMESKLSDEPVFRCAASAKGGELSIELHVKWTTKAKRVLTTRVAWELFPDGFFDADAIGADGKTTSVKKVERVVSSSREITTLKR